MKTDCDIAVIGGGASGMAAAIAAARGGCNVCLLEALPRVGKKLLATGNGRCNISNRNADFNVCRTECPAVLKQIYHNMPPERVWCFLNSIGIELVAEDEGRLYPRSNQASSVLDMLRLELERLGVKVICEAEISCVKKSADIFKLLYAEQSITAKRVIFANGSKASPQLGGTDSGVKLLRSLGHTAVPMRPSLVPLKCTSPVLWSLKGVRVRCRVSMICKGSKVYTDFGEVQFGDGVLSGIVIFQLSAHLAREGIDEALIAIDLMPEQNEAQTYQMLKKRRDELGYLPLESFLAGLFNKKIGVCLIKAVSALPMTEKAEKLSDNDLKKLTKAVKEWNFIVNGSASWQQAQCMSGGIRLDEFGADLQSRFAAGVYACGELLDCDCDCGGYNLHWAWTSGITAGERAARALTEEMYI